MIKKSFILSLLLGLCAVTFSQNIAKYEYWIDDQIDQRHSENTSNSDIEFQVDVSQLTDGIHSLGFRAADSQGSWSMASSHYFLKYSEDQFSTQKATKVVQFEYWFDDNIDDRISVNASNNEISLQVNAGSLTDGIHSINIRAVDDIGQWTKTASYYFLKATKRQQAAEEPGVLTKYEYWFDEDVDKRVTTANTDGIVNLPVDVQTLTKGIHCLTFRMADSNGQWSAPISYYFLVPPTPIEAPEENRITGYRYWFNDAIEKAIHVSLNEATSSLTLTENIPVNNVTLTPENMVMKSNANGEAVVGVRNTMNIMFQDNQGKWSTIQTDTFEIAIDDENITITDFIRNPNADNNKEGWTVTGTMSVQNDDGDPYFHLTGNPVTMTQTVSGLLPGAYLLTAKGRVSPETTLEICVDESSYEVTGAEWNQFTIPFVSNNSSFEIKIKKTGSGWADIDNLQLGINTATSLDVAIAENVDVEQYKGMKLILSSDNISLSAVITDSHSYKFNGLSTKKAYSLSLQNAYGQMFVQMTDLHLTTGTSSLTLENIAKTSMLSIKVVKENGEDVTSHTSIVWYDVEGNPIDNGTALGAIPEGTTISYQVSLDEELSKQYQPVPQSSLTATEGSHTITVMMQAIPLAKASGQVRDEDGNGISAAITVVQDGYTTYAYTDEKGYFNIELKNLPTDFTFSHDGYMNATVHQEDLSRDTSLGVIRLTRISGFTTALDIIFHQAAEDGDTQWTNGINNIELTLVNLTTGKDITDFQVQNSSLIINSGASTSDRIQVTAKSRQQIFDDVTKEFILSANNGRIELTLTELGGIEVSYVSSPNEHDIAFIYNQKGELVNRCTFASKETTIEHLKSGRYTIVVMGDNGMIGSVPNIGDLESMGLAEGSDYAAQSVTVRDGEMTQIVVNVVPEIDASKFELTAANTSYLANKMELVVGNMITMTARIDFNERYAGQIGQAALVVDIPEQCSFVENSVVIGTEVRPYIMNGNRLTVQLTDEDIDRRIRFCLIPTEGGDFTTSAYAAVNYHGEKMLPIGSVTATATDIAITAPSVTAVEEVSVSGISMPQAAIEVYDGQHLIGTARALKDGRWSVDCELYKPTNYSTHELYAKITSPGKPLLTTGAQQCTFNKDAVLARSVTMSFYNGWLRKNVDVVFDFETGKTSSNNYMFYKATDITFVADLTANDTTVVKGVTFNVHTNQKEIRHLQGFFDIRRNRWVAVDHFASNNLPVNLTLDIYAFPEMTIDSALTNQFRDDLITIVDSIDKETEQMEDVLQQLEDLVSQDVFEKDKADSLVNVIYYYRVNINRNYGNGRNNNNGDNTGGQQGGNNPEDAFAGKNTPDDVIDVLAKNNEKNLVLVDRINANIPTYKDYQADIPSMNYHDIMTPAVKTDFPNARKAVESGYFFIPEGSWSINNGYTESHLTEIQIENRDGDRITMDYSKAMQREGVSSLLSESGGLFLDQYHDKLFNTIALNNGSNDLRNALSVLSNASISIGENLAIDEYGLRELYTTLKREKVIPAQTYLRVVKEEKNLIKMSKQVKPAGIFGKGLAALSACDVVGSMIDMGKIGRRWDKMIKNIQKNCNQEEGKFIADIAKEAKKTILKKKGWNTVGKAGNTTAAIGGILGAPLSAGTSLGLAVGGTLGGIKLEYQNQQFLQENEREMFDVYMMVAKNKNCTAWPLEEGFDLDPIFSPIVPIHDPSGYVYEAVTSNRLKDVKASIFYKDDSPVLWDATEFSQTNPIITDETGLYAWDVPQGMWQVRFEKDGYETAQTDWLPVPPPQLEVNIAMSEGISPSVEKAHGVESGITLTFNKYLRPETLPKSNFAVTLNDQVVNGRMEMVNMEEDPYTGKEYASKIKFVPSKPFKTRDIVSLTVKKDIETYAGIQMANDTTLQIIIEPEITAILTDTMMTVGYDKTATLQIDVLPAEASRGRKLAIESTSPLIASVSDGEVIINDEGRAEVTITGELPGSASIHLTLSDAGLESFTDISVVMNETTVALPKASARTGNKVEYGYLLTLSCSTPGATIYYTTDGSCPCDEQTRQKYSGPIALTADVIIKAIAVKEGMIDSDIATYVYTVEGVTNNMVNTPVNGKAHESTYNLSGQKLKKPQKGINIRNGQKILR